VVRPAAPVTTFALDASTMRPAGSDVVIGGSPLRLFRLTATGAALFDQLAAGEDVTDSTLVDRLLDAGAIHPLLGGGGSPFEPADVTVVIPAFGADASTLRRLRAACAGAAAVVIVDDASEPPLAGVTDSTMLRLGTNVGPAVARNAGLGAATTPLIAFIDTDVCLSPGWLEPLLDHFADERVALVAPRIASAPGTSALARYEQRCSPLDLGAERARIAPGTRVSYVPAAALVVRAAALHEIGGFDRALRVGEDVDVVWRLAGAGWRCRYEPSVVVHHQPRSSWRRLLSQRVAYGSSAAPLARRHPGAVAPVRISGWSAGAWALLLSGHPRAALVVAGGTSAALVPKLTGVPAAVSVRLAATGHLRAGQQLGAAARRAWWPAFAAAAVVSRRARWLALLAAAPALLDGGPLRILDDMAYGAGVWKGAITERCIAALRPDLRSWPHRARDDP